MNLDRIEAILQLLYRQQHVGEVSVAGDGWRVQARKGHGVPTVMPNIDVEDVAPAEERHVIRAGRVGIFREGKQPIGAGDRVSKGSPLGQIDSMRILNPILAEEGGTILEVRVEDGDPVEFGQELFVLAPLGPLSGE